MLMVELPTSWRGQLLNDFARRLNVLTAFPEKPSPKTSCEKKASMNVFVLAAKAATSNVLKDTALPQQFRVRNI